MRRKSSEKGIRKGSGKRKDGSRNDRGKDWDGNEKGG